VFWSCHNIFWLVIASFMSISNRLDLGKRCFGHAIIYLVGYSLIYMNFYVIFFQFLLPDEIKLYFYKFISYSLIQ
jgi:hypothetical protein